MKLLRLMIATLTLATVGCASAPPPPPGPPKPTVNVTGNWIGSFVCDDPSLGSGIVVMKLNQDGSRVIGDVGVTGSARLTNVGAEASIQGDQLVLVSNRAKGSFTVSGDHMSGNFQDALCGGKLTMNREPYQSVIATSRLRGVNLTVEALDLTTRMITLRGPQGDTLTMQVDERVKNLPQISVGDVITVAYYESWVLDLNKPGEQPGVVAVGTAGVGQPPAGFAARRSTIQATVTAINAAKSSATFTGPKGTAEVSVAHDPQLLSRLKVGETYNVTYTENLAVVVDKATKR
jgi:hypothetical protein